ncbi:hypothetical protein MUO69_05930 [Candidatus Bathyarchaeota archaeon]|nr:hypothetical protein [Candidatus Bathyarchaeota archaeon]
MQRAELALTQISALAKKIEPSTLPELGKRQKLLSRSHSQEKTLQRTLHAIRRIKHASKVRIIVATMGL